ncbi:MULTISPECIES: AI-2E family transporter [unclassified Meridianimarinicoccus]|uniref:AI-2E family transporter n=1 Tax=unclassified Meridianimarinicoccus TaxID=2923344 RepID=UPI001867D06B|nr:AI-2E family transporter [Fluviibacterium sp. MJW13]
MNIRDVFHFTALTALVGWFLVVGGGVLLPLVVAVMLTYVLIGASQGLRKLPGLSLLPIWFSYVLALTLFGLALLSISLIAVSNLRDIARTAPDTEDNILALTRGIGSMFGLHDTPSWDTLRAITLDRLDVPDLSLQVLTSVASAGGYVVLIGTYMVFMVAERGPMSIKIDMLLPDTTERGNARHVFNKINNQIVTYLSTKTLINVILGVVSYALMWLMGMDNAVFWAFLVAIFNYIPYVGSLVAVGVIVFYRALVTGDLTTILTTIVLLTAAQVYVGNWLEPRVMSRSLNLSPLTVLVALVVWGSLWGLPGAIIAVPMTSIVMIVLASFKSTRAVAVLASRDGEIT